MKKKTIEALEPNKTKKNGKIVTVQKLDDILVFNIWNNKILEGRQALNTQTCEYCYWNSSKKEWNNQKFCRSFGVDEIYYYVSNETKKRLKFSDKEEEKLVIESLQHINRFNTKAWDLIDYTEREYNSSKRENAENNRIVRVKAVMGKVPSLPKNLDQWIFEKATGSADYAFFNKDENKWKCTGCEKQFDEKYLHRVDGGKKIRHNDMVICPRCKKTIQVKKRNKKVEIFPHITLLQPIDEKISVARHIDADICWSYEGRDIALNESVRIILNKLNNKSKYACELYYNQYSSYGAWGGGIYDRTYGSFDNKSNPSHRYTFPGYLYETGIKETLENTCYSSWTRLFEQMAAVGVKVHYNKLMIAQNNLSIIQMVESLFKGRFYKLLLETSEKISPWSCNYEGPLKLNGQTIEEVFDIKDRQKINRIREINGGEKILKWMRWSDETEEKIPQDALEWLISNNIEKDDINFLPVCMSITKIMNYVKKQQAAGYKEKSVKSVLSQWSDYICMCKKLKKHITDEMVCKPRELKRRHDEAVTEIALIEAELKADEYSKRFPGVEDVLKEIKPKYEYQGEKYFIIVPERPVDIIAEGRTLHHCAGSSDRYFDRIKSRETYICFLRRTEEPKTPYYTIEVEPGGTIRQHRGYLDEEPGIKDIRPFLKEWQREIKKRINEQDKHLAKISEVKRVENINELIEKNNTRVLNGLMEDFMEAM